MTEVNKSERMAEVNISGKITEVNKSGKMTDEKIVESGELAEIRRSLEEVEKLRFAKGVTEKEYIRLESASVDLRDREREIIASLGVEIAGQIKASSLSLLELSKRIKARTAEMSKLPKTLDKISDVILEVIDIVRRIQREM